MIYTAVPNSPFFIRYKRVLATAAGLTAIVSVWAQAPDSGSGDRSAEEELFVLSPFIVDASQDTGYRATNTISGTRLNTPIKELPMPLEVLTNEFITDTGATDMREALAFSSGVQTQEFALSPASGAGNAAGANAVGSGETSPSAAGSVGDPTTNALTIRGYSVPFQQRMGYRVGAAVQADINLVLGGMLDSVNIERVEVVRGPASLLYGLGVISGVVNVIPKMPLAEHRQALNLGVGSDNYYRASFEATGPVREGLNFRVAGSLQDEGHYTDYREERKRYAVGQLDYTYKDFLNVFVELQAGNFRIEGIGPRYLYDNSFITDNAFIEKDQRNEWGEYRNWYEEQKGSLSGSYRVSGPDTFYERDETSTLVNINITPTDSLSLQGGIFYTEQDAEEFNVNLRTIGNREANMVIRDEVPDLAEYFTYPLIEDAPVNAKDEVAKIARYWWRNIPTSAETFQTRFEVNYEIEHQFFGKRMTHNFLLGVQYIKDAIESVSGDGASQVNQVLDLKEADNDPYVVRSIYDFTPIRYNDEPLAIPGSDALRYDIWFTGYYGIYQGRWLNDDLTVIAGIRRDRYDTRRTEFERPLISVEKENNGYYGGDNPINGVQRVNSLFDEPEVSTSGTFALSYRLTEDISVYGLVAEGVSPNTGQTDGLDRGIAPESTTSQEIGFKFDLMEEKLSGTIAFYRIQRESATWDYNYAPSPADWVGGSQYQRSSGATFDAEKAVNGEEPLAIGVNAEIFYELFGEDFIGFKFERDPDSGRFQKVPLEGLLLPDPEFYSRRNWFFLTADENGSFLNNPFLVALDEAFNREELDLSDSEWMQYTKTESGFGNNPSNRSGARVTFEDEVTGMDAQIIFSPLTNWQLIVNYAYSEREATSGFQMVDAFDPNVGKNFGTNYDVWIRRLGIENFEDPKRASTMSGGGPEGKSLFLGPEHSASLWSKYTFSDGRLRNLSLMGGVIYTSRIPTSVPIGGRQFAVNRFATPDTEERYRVDMGLSYEREIWNAIWRVSLNIYNLLDDRESITTVDFGETTEEGNPVQRRSVIYYEPRSFRLSLSILF